MIGPPPPGTPEEYALAAMLVEVDRHLPAALRITDRPDLRIAEGDGMTAFVVSDAWYVLAEPGAWGFTESDSGEVDVVLFVDGERVESATVGPGVLARPGDPAAN